MSTSSNNGAMRLTTVSTATNDTRTALSDAEVFLSALHKCKDGLIWKESMQRFNINRLKYCAKHLHDVQEGVFTVDPYHAFDIFERGKPRHILACTVRDRVFMRMFCDEILIPKIRKKIIYDNGSSIENRGISFARKRILVHLHRYFREHKTNRGYILQIDFAKFFASIDHEILKERLCALIDGDEYARQIITTIVDSFEGDRGLGIGSQLAQCAGIFYPVPIDNFCKTVRRCRYYGRYMDDIYIIHHDCDFLRELLKDITALAQKLRLDINESKTHIGRLDRPFCYLKSVYRLTETGGAIYTPARETITRMRRKLRRIHRKHLLPPDKAQTLYKSWRNNLIKNYPRSCHNTVKSMDTLFKSLYGEIK